MILIFLFCSFWNNSHVCYWEKYLGRVESIAYCIKLLSSLKTLLMQFPPPQKKNLECSFWHTTSSKLRISYSVWMKLTIPYWLCLVWRIRFIELDLVTWWRHVAVSFCLNVFLHWLDKCCQVIYQIQLQVQQVA